MENSKQEHITEEMIKEQLNNHKFIGNDGLLYTSKKKFFIKD